MSNDAIILPGGDYSKDDVEYAANDAQTVTAQSKVIQTVVGVMIDAVVSTCLPGVLDVELTKGWDLQNLPSWTDDRVGFRAEGVGSI